MKGITVKLKCHFDELSPTIPFAIERCVKRVYLILYLYKKSNIVYIEYVRQSMYRNVGTSKVQIDCN